MTCCRPLDAISPRLHVNDIQMWRDTIQCCAHLRSCGKGLTIKHCTASTCDDAIHLLQGGCQHVTGVSHHHALFNGVCERGKEREMRAGRNRDKKTINNPWKRPNITECQSHLGHGVPKKIFLSFSFMGLSYKNGCSSQAVYKLTINVCTHKNSHDRRGKKFGDIHKITQKTPSHINRENYSQSEPFSLFFKWTQFFLPNTGFLEDKNKVISEAHYPTGLVSGGLAIISAYGHLE